jgi:hypothetical protein
LRTRHQHTIITYSAFDTVSAVPGRLSLAMMLAGLLLIGTAMARQRG